MRKRLRKHKGAGVVSRAVNKGAGVVSPAVRCLRKERKRERN